MSGRSTAASPSVRVPAGTAGALPHEIDAMRRALGLAARGPLGPNPRVGCVLLAPDGTVLGEGWHRGAGTPHAEVAALADAATRRADVRGATAVVTLEPCDHTGRTGPCSLALLEAGVARVVLSVPDPNPAAAGGAQRLRGGGAAVVTDVLHAEGVTALGAWWHAVRAGRPFVTLKLATSLDGRVAAADGSSRWITSQVSRRHAHALRAEVGAIAVGSGTALRDDPSLTARRADGTLHEAQPLRVVVGYRDVPAGSRLRGPGGELVQLRTHDPAQVLAALHEREVRHVLVEGGPTLAAAFLAAGLVDEVRAYVAPVLLGAGPSALGDLGVGTITDAVRLVPREVVPLGPDVLVVAEPAPSAPTASGPTAPVPTTQEDS